MLFLQLRIDFLDLVLAQPDGDGICNTDFISITGGNTVVPLLCGDNTGQTLFVDFNGNTAITITVTATLATTFSRRWNILLTQLGCDCPGIGKQYYHHALRHCKNKYIFGNLNEKNSSAKWMPAILHGYYWDHKQLQLRHRS